MFLLDKGAKKEGELYKEGSDWTKANMHKLPAGKVLTVNFTTMEKKKKKNGIFAGISHH